MTYKGCTHFIFCALSISFTRFQQNHLVGQKMLFTEQTRVGQHRSYLITMSYLESKDHLCQRWWHLNEDLWSYMCPVTCELTGGPVAGTGLVHMGGPRTLESPLYPSAIPEDNT